MLFSQLARELNIAHLSHAFQCSTYGFRSSRKYLHKELLMTHFSGIYN